MLYRQIANLHALFQMIPLYIISFVTNSVLLLNLIPSAAKRSSFYQSVNKTWAIWHDSTEPSSDQRNSRSKDTADVKANCTDRETVSSVQVIGQCNTVLWLRLTTIPLMMRKLYWNHNCFYDCTWSNDLLIVAQHIWLALTNELLRIQW